jgi:exopolyphosphatase/guanosine-5'-triphosphate,3'-diphosphate pyrophosphatase
MNTTPFTPKNIAVLDVGSNSIKVLVVANHPKGMRPIFTATRETRIGTGIGQHPALLNETAMELAIQSIQELLDAVIPFDPQKIRLVATSAVREAENREIFKQKVADRTGYTLEILAGEEEALGIAKGVITDPILADLPSFKAFDLGGGSLECILVEKEADAHKIVRAQSLPLGAVRLTEAFVEDSHQPLKPEAIAAIRENVEATLREAGFEGPIPAMVGTSGAFGITRGILAHRLSCLPYQLPPRLEVPFLKALFRELSNMTLEERHNVPRLPPSRADIFPTALLTVITIADLLGVQEVYHSSRNLRFGLAAQLMETNHTPILA